MTPHGLQTLAALQWHGCLLASSDGGGAGEVIRLQLEVSTGPGKICSLHVIVGKVVDLEFNWGDANQVVRWPNACSIEDAMARNAESTTFHCSPGSPRDLPHMFCL